MIDGLIPHWGSSVLSVTSEGLILNCEIPIITHNNK
jgi:hypothetical protein